MRCVGLARDARPRRGRGDVEVERIEETPAGGARGVRGGSERPAGGPLVVPHQTHQLFLLTAGTSNSEKPTTPPRQGGHTLLDSV